jgi:hypothetical protein
MVENEYGHAEIKRKVSSSPISRTGGKEHIGTDDMSEPLLASDDDHYVPDDKEAADVEYYQPSRVSFVFCFHDFFEPRS